MPLDCNVTIARTVMRAGEIHETSWNDLKKAYEVNKQKAAEQAAQNNKELAQLVYLLLVCCWNDIHDWAQEVIRKAEVV